MYIRNGSQAGWAFLDCLVLRAVGGVPLFVYPWVMFLFSGFFSKVRPHLRESGVLPRCTNVTPMGDKFFTGWVCNYEEEETGCFRIDEV